MARDDVIVALVLGVEVAVLLFLILYCIHLIGARKRPSLRPEPSKEEEYVDEDTEEEEDEEMPRLAPEPPVQILIHEEDDVEPATEVVERDGDREADTSDTWTSISSYRNGLKSALDVHHCRSATCELCQRTKEPHFEVVKPKRRSQNDADYFPTEVWQDEVDPKDSGVSGTTLKR